MSSWPPNKSMISPMRLRLVSTSTASAFIVKSLLARSSSRVPGVTSSGCRPSLEGPSFLQRTMSMGCPPINPRTVKNSGVTRKILLMFVSHHLSNASHEGATAQKSRSLFSLPRSMSRMLPPTSKILMSCVMCNSFGS